MKYGLDSKEVEISEKEHGKNVLPEAEPVTFWGVFKEQFEDPMIRILLVIVVIMLVMFALGFAKIYEPIGTIIAILIVSFFNSKTEVSNDTKFRALKLRIKKEECKVYRNGTVTSVIIDDIVVGDAVLLQSGDKIPADGVLVDGEISVNNASLNGENEDCKKTFTDDMEMPDEITGDTFVDEHTLFRGSVVTDGDGVLLVRKVGIATMMGKMAEEMQEDEPDSPLKVKLAKLANQISMFGYIGATVIALVYMVYFIVSAGGFGVYFSQAWNVILQNVIDAVSLAILIIVCAVPEGLPLMISLVLMQNTSKMLDHNVLVRKSIGIETAGSLNILFSDKTGTITKGMLEVVSLADGTGKKLSETDDLIDVAICCNTQSVFDKEGEVLGGNATDKALLKYIGKDKFDKVVDKYTIIEKQDFNSRNKFSQVYISETNRTYYKGAPERLLENAKSCVKDGKVVDLDKKQIDKYIDELAEKSMRVIAFGYSNSKLENDTIQSDIIITGLVGIRDDVRPEAKDAIKEVQGAGIQVVMITGDRLETAVAIAKDAALIKEDSDIALTSKDLNAMSDDEIKEKLPNIRVIARALPTDKSRMVRICQEMNLVVGMTGDGVNDSPALKRADVGFAMGSGTEVAKEASKIIITDDNFRSIKDAIWYGRTIYNNILKFCKFQLVINVAAVVISAIAPFFGVEEPLKVTHLLFVNLVMDSLGAIMLGNEPALPKYLKAKPRKRDESIISKKMATQIGIAGFYMVVLSFFYLKTPFIINMFNSEEAHLTGYFVLFIACALFNGFNVRDEKYAIFARLNENTGFLKVIGIVMVLQAFIVYSGAIGLKFIGEMFSCVPISITNYLFILVLGATMIPVDMIRKIFVKED